MLQLRCVRILYWWPTGNAGQSTAQQVSLVPSTQVSKIYLLINVYHDPVPKCIISKYVLCIHIYIHIRVCIYIIIIIYVYIPLKPYFKDIYSVVSYTWKFSWYEIFAEQEANRIFAIIFSRITGPSCKGSTCYVLLQIFNCCKVANFHGLNFH